MQIHASVTKVLEALLHFDFCVKAQASDWAPPHSLQTNNHTGKITVLQPNMCAAGCFVRQFPVYAVTGNDHM